MGGWSRKWQFPLLYVMKTSLRRGWVVLKSLKTPLRNIKMAPYLKNGLYDLGIYPLFLIYENKEYFRRILRSIILLMILGQDLSNEFFTKFTHEVSRVNMIELDTEETNAPMKWKRIVKIRARL